MIETALKATLPPFKKSSGNTTVVKVKIAVFKNEEVEVAGSCGESTIEERLCVHARSVAHDNAPHQRYGASVVTCSS